MQLVRSRLGDDIYIRAGVASERRVGLGRLNLKLLDGVGIRDSGSWREAVITLLKVVRVHSIDLEIVIEGSASIDTGPGRDLTSATSTELGRICNVRRDSR